MKFKKGVEIVTGDFWYDVTIGGYIKPEKLLEDKTDVKRVQEAVKILREFERSARDQDILIDL